MNPKRVMPILAVIALAAAQQTVPPPPSPEIRGVVLDSGTNQPVADAQISLSVQTPGPVKINGGWKADDSRQLKTDYRGAFTLSFDRPGTYRVEAKKDGYLAPGTSGPPEFAEVTLTADKPTADVKLFLATTGRLTGTVVDEGTRKPIANLRLSAVQVRKSSSFWFPGAPPARTDADGKFVLSGLKPGDYAVEIGRQTDEEQRVLTKFTDKDAAAVDLDYEHSYWPGGHGQEAVQPLTVVSGGTLHVGVLPVKKGPYYRVRVRIPVSNCNGNGTMHISESLVTSLGAAMHPLAQAPCGKDMLVSGFSPGNYRLLLSIDDRTRENRGTASVAFSIINENLEITAPLTPGVTVDGAFVPAEGAKPPDFAKLKISLNSVDHVGFPDEPMNVPADAEGKVRLEYVRPLGHRVFLSGLGPGSYVKEMRYNGIPLSGDIVPLDIAASAHSLIIVIDDKPGTILGAVTSGDKPVPHAFVIARKWPPNGAQNMSDWARSRGDDTGNFQMTGLAPGEYRIIALRSVMPDMTFAMLEQALAAGKKVEIGPGGLQNMKLELTEFR
jgi:Carboxypeptidase regulatory-like domain